MTPQHQATTTDQKRFPSKFQPGTNHAAMSPATQPAAEQATPDRQYDNEAQAPTHDALSAIYNRGY